MRVEGLAPRSTFGRRAPGNCAAAGSAWPPGRGCWAAVERRAAGGRARPRRLAVRASTSPRRPSSITGQSTCAGLSGLARPAQAPRAECHDSSAALAGQLARGTGIRLERRDDQSAASGCSRSAGSTAAKSASRSRPSRAARVVAKPSRTSAPTSPAPRPRSGRRRGRARRRAGSSERRARRTSRPRASGSTTGRRGMRPRASARRAGPPLGAERARRSRAWSRLT